MSISGPSATEEGRRAPCLSPPSPAAVSPTLQRKAPGTMGSNVGLTSRPTGCSSKRGPWPCCLHGPPRSLRPRPPLKLWRPDPAPLALCLCSRAPPLLLLTVSQDSPNAASAPSLQGPPRILGGESRGSAATTVSGPLRDAPLPQTLKGKRRVCMGVGSPYLPPSAASTGTHAGPGRFHILTVPWGLLSSRLWPRLRLWGERGLSPV